MYIHESVHWTRHLDRNQITYGQLCGQPLAVDSVIGGNATIILCGHGLWWRGMGRESR